jgi:hypothetical protein
LDGLSAEVSVCMGGGKKESGPKAFSSFKMEKG